MIELKCPFCGKKLKELYINGNPIGFRCKNKNCPETNIMCGTEYLWQALIDTKKKLDIAVDTLKLMYQGSGDPQDIMRYIDNRWTSVRRLCKQTLEQINDKEE